MCWLRFRAVTFRQFVANLLYNLQRMPSLSSLYRELSDLVIRYDDCVLTCTIPFTRRRRRLGESSSDRTAAERWRSLAADIDTNHSRMAVDVGLCEALAFTFFGSKLRCHRQRLRHVQIHVCILSLKFVGLPVRKIWRTFCLSVSRPGDLDLWPLTLKLVSFIASGMGNVP